MVKCPELDVRGVDLTDISRQGFLTRRGRVYHSWKRRFVILQVRRAALAAPVSPPCAHPACEHSLAPHFSMRAPVIAPLTWLLVHTARRHCLNRSPQHNFLFYYDEPAEKPAGVICLDDAEIGEREDVDGHSWCFEVSTRAERVFIFSAASDAERTAWLTSIRVASYSHVHERLMLESARWELRERRLGIVADEMRHAITEYAGLLAGLDDRRSGDPPEDNGSSAAESEATSRRATAFHERLEWLSRSVDELLVHVRGSSAADGALAAARDGGFVQKETALDTSYDSRLESPRRNLHREISDLFDLSSVDSPLRTRQADVAVVPARAQSDPVRAGQHGGSAAAPDTPTARLLVDGANIHTGVEDDYFRVPSGSERDDSAPLSRGNSAPIAIKSAAEPAAGSTQAGTGDARHKLHSHRRQATDRRRSLRRHALGASPDERGRALAFGWGADGFSTSESEASVVDRRLSTSGDKESPLRTSPVLTRGGHADDASSTASVHVSRSPGSGSATTEEGDHGGNYAPLLRGRSFAAEVDSSSGTSLLNLSSDSTERISAAGWVGTNPAGVATTQVKRQVSVERTAGLRDGSAPPPHASPPRATAPRERERRRGTRRKEEEEAARRIASSLSAFGFSTRASPRARRRERQKRRQRRASGGDAGAKAPQTPPAHRVSSSVESPGGSILSRSVGERGREPVVGAEIEAEEMFGDRLTDVTPPRAVRHPPPVSGERTGGDRDPAARSASARPPAPRSDSEGEARGRTTRAAAHDGQSRWRGGSSGTDELALASSLTKSDDSGPLSRLRRSRFDSFGSALSFGDEGAERRREAPVYGAVDQVMSSSSNTDTLKHLLLAPGMVLFRAMLTNMPVQVKEAAGPLTRTFASAGGSHWVRALRRCADAVVSAADTPAMLFRRESLSTGMLRLVAHSLGGAFVGEALRAPLRALLDDVAAGESVEIDERLVRRSDDGGALTDSSDRDFTDTDSTDSGAGGRGGVRTARAVSAGVGEREMSARLDDNARRLVAQADRFLASTLTALRALPFSLRVVCAQLVKSVARRFGTGDGSAEKEAWAGTATATPASGETTAEGAGGEAESAAPMAGSPASLAVGGFLILRLLSPAIMAPQGFGLVNAPLSPQARRALTLVAKMIQALTTGVGLGSKESCMARVAPFVERHQHRMLEALRGISKLDRRTADTAALCEPEAALFAAEESAALADLQTAMRLLSAPQNVAAVTATLEGMAEREAAVRPSAPDPLFIAARLRTMAHATRQIAAMREMEARRSSGSGSSGAGSGAGDARSHRKSRNESEKMLARLARARGSLF